MPYNKKLFTTIVVIGNYVYIRTRKFILVRVCFMWRHTPTLDVNPTNNSSYTVFFILQKEHLELAKAALLTAASPGPNPYISPEQSFLHCLHCPYPFYLCGEAQTGRQSFSLVGNMQIKSSWWKRTKKMSNDFRVPYNFQPVDKFIYGNVNTFP